MVSSLPQQSMPANGLKDDYRDEKRVFNFKRSPINSPYWLFPFGLLKVYSYNIRQFSHRWWNKLELAVPNLKEVDRCLWPDPFNGMIQFGIGWGQGAGLQKVHRYIGGSVRTQRWVVPRWPSSHSQPNLHNENWRGWLVVCFKQPDSKNSQ